MEQELEQEQEREREREREQEQERERELELEQEQERERERELELEQEREQERMKEESVGFFNLDDCDVANVGRDWGVPVYGKPIGISPKKANAIIAERAKVVYGSPEVDDWSSWRDSDPPHNVDTHRALLICVEPLEKASPKMILISRADILNAAKKIGDAGYFSFSKWEEIPIEKPICPTCGHQNGK